MACQRGKKIYVEFKKNVYLWLCIGLHTCCHSVITTGGKVLCFSGSLTIACEQSHPPPFGAILSREAKWRHMPGSKRGGKGHLHAVVWLSAKHSALPTVSISGAPKRGNLYFWEVSPIGWRYITSNQHPDELVEFTQHPDEPLSTRTNPLN